VKSQIHTPSRGSARTIARCCSLALLALLVSRQTASAATPNISGIWKLTHYSPQIRTADGQPPPLQPQAAEIYKKNSAAHRARDLSYDAPAQACLSPGMPRLMLLPYPIQIIQRPHQLTMLYQWNNRFRIVDLTGKPPVVDYPQYIGVGVGHVEGDTVVLETTGLIETTFLDDAGLPHSDELHLTERYRLQDGGRTLVNDITIQDPKTFMQSWSTRLTYRRLPARTEIVEDVCRERVAHGGPAFDLARWK